MVDMIVELVGSLFEAIPLVGWLIIAGVIAVAVLVMTVAQHIH